MKKRRIVMAVLLALLLPGLVLAEGEGTNGLSRMMTVQDFVKSYNSVLLASVPAGDALLDAEDTAYIKAAQTLLEADIANPAAATIHDARLYDIDPYGRFCCWFDVTESAALGTFTRGSYYVFVQALRADGSITYLEGSTVLAGDDPARIQQYRAANEFDVDPAEKAVKAYLQAADGYVQENFVRLSADEVYAPYVYTGRGYSMTLYTGPGEGQLAGMALSIGEAQLRSFPMAERIGFFERGLAGAFAAMQGETGTGAALAVIEKLFDTTRLTPSGETVYENEMLYGCFAEDGTVTFVAMPVAAAVYEAKAYWWVSQGTAYLLAQAESAMRALEYDSAIWYYEEAGLAADTDTALARAYYERAAGFLDAGQYDKAIAGFEQAAGYGDSAARIAQAYYEKGDAEFDAGNTLLALQAFARAGNYEDAQQRVLSCAYWLGEDALAAKDYDAAEAYFEQAIGYLDAQEKIKQVHYERAEQLAQAGNEAEAALYYERASGYLDADDKVGAEHYNRGEAAMANGNYAAAIEAFTQAGNYKDSKEKLAQLAEIQTGQAYEKAARQCSVYFDNPVDTAFPTDVYDALAAMGGYGESTQLMQKLDEVKRILDVLGQIGTPHRGARIRDYFGISEVSQANDRVALEFTSWFVFSTYDAGFQLEAALDRSTYTVSGWARAGESFAMYGNDATLDLLYRFTAMITGNTKDTAALQQTIHDVQWAWVGERITATIFDGDYKLDFTLLPGERGSYLDFEIVATRNAY